MSTIAPIKSLIFIDAAVTDYQSLINGLVLGTEAIVLDSAQDGVEQITATLAIRSDIQSVHILSHGSSGNLQLGTTTLNRESIDRYQAQLQGWRSALTENADILLYGCDVAGDDSGEAFVRSLSQITGADVAASNDLTGSAQLDGDWDLEVQTGAIEAAPAFQPSTLANYHSVLPIVFSESFADNAAGWTLGTEWQIGSATASTPVQGNSDPATDTTPTFDNGVAGVVIGGNASTALHGFYYLTSPVINTNTPGTFSLQFQRWLNSDYAPLMQNVIEVYNGSVWSQVWASGGNPAIFDNAWSLQSYDITPYKSPNMQVRFGFNIGSGGVSTVGSWNIDDVIIRINTAPTLTDTSVTLTAINEDASIPSGLVGTLILQLADLVGGAGQNNITDPDIGATAGIAITAADTTNGTWFYSINNGTNWNVLGSRASNNARLLAADANTRLYFQPNANYNGSIANAITFRAWDTTTGSNGGTADPSINGGATAFSTATDTVAIAIIPVNDAPILTGTATLTAINEDALDAANKGTKVSTLINGLATDVDGDPKAIAITGVDNTKGTWQYSTDGGAIWTDFSVTPSDSTATVLGATSLYQASLGTAPTAQGQVSFTNLNPIAPTPLGTQTFDSSGTILNTDVNRNIYAGYSNFNIPGATPVNPSLPKLNNVEGYSVSFNLELLTESHTNNDRAGFSIVVVSNDKTQAIELGFQDGKIFAQKDAGFTAAESVLFNTKQSVDYRLEVLGNSYTLFANSTSILTGALRDYSAFSGTIDPYETPNFIFLGDDSTSAKGSFNLSQVVVQTDNRVRFVPNANENGNSTINFRAWDTTDGKSVGAIVNASINGSSTSFSSNSTTATITVNPINDAPTISGTSGIAIAEDSPYSFTPTAVDIDLGDTLTFSIINKPAWAIFDPVTGKLSGIPVNGDVGITTGIVVSVSDGTAPVGLPAFNLAVTNINDVPTVTNAIADQTVSQDAPFTFTLPTNTFTDVDAGDTLTYTATLSNSSPLPTWLTFSPTTRTFSGTPRNANVGSLALKVKATDKAGAMAEDGFIVKVANINRSPVIGTLITPTSQQGIATQPFTLKIPTGAFTDLDAGDTLTFSASLESGAPLPPWLVFDAKAGSFSGSPDIFSVGNLSLKVNATDAQGLKISQLVKLAIANPTGITGTPTPLIDFSSSKKGITRKAKKGQLLRGTNRSDILKGTKGNDRINSSGRRDSRSKDKLYGFNGNDRLKAGGGNDYADGGRGNDFLQGGKGCDLLQGSDGIDRLLGGKGDDLLIGGNGADTLIGGSGRDMFVFANVNEGKDAIADFTLSEDVIDLRSLFSQPQFAGATSYVRYLKYVQLAQVGASTEIKVDADGSGVGSTFTTLAMLNNIGIGAVSSRNFVIS